MSLEQTLQRNNELLEALNANFTRLFGFSSSAPEAPATEKPKAKTPAKTATAAAVEAEVAQQNSEAAASTVEPTEVPKALRKQVGEEKATDAIPYDDVKNEVLTAVKDEKRGREKVVGLLAKYNVQRADQLKPEQYSEFLTALKKL